MGLENARETKIALVFGETGSRVMNRLETRGLLPEFGALLTYLTDGVVWGGGR